MEEIKINYHDGPPAAVVLTFVGGFLDAYTFTLHDGAFATAQTGNVITAMISFVNLNFYGVFLKVMPIVAFAFGIFSAHLLEDRFMRREFNIWRLVVLGIETTIFFVLGFAKKGVPDTLVTIPISFTAGLQMTSFGTVRGLAYANLFTTGNLKKLIDNLYFTLTRGSAEAKSKLKQFFWIILTFISGALISAWLSKVIGVRAIWLCALLIGGFTLVQGYYIFRFFREYQHNDF